MHSLEVVLALVLGASLVSALAEKARAPAPAMLVVAGLLIALIPGVPTPRLTPDLVLLVVLPPLLSSAAGEQNLRLLRTQWRPLVYLAVGLVVVSALLTALVAAPLLHISGPLAFVLGTILASTDPVAVTALGRRLRLPQRLDSVVQAESLFNDATSLVLFSASLDLVTGPGNIRPAHLVVEVVRLAVGGAAAGGAVAAVTSVARTRTQDPVAHTVLALVTPYAAYIAADSFGAGGVTSVVVAGLVTGLSDRRLPAPVRVQLKAVNATVVFLLESVIFALIGLQLPGLVRTVHVGVSGWLLPSLALMVTVLAVRFLAVAPLTLTVRRSYAGPSVLRTSLIATWAGTRGVVPLAAAISLPLATAAGTPLAARDLVELCAVVVVVMTLTIQGLTLAPLSRRTRVSEPADRNVEAQQAARRVMQDAARARLDELTAAEAASPDVLSELGNVLSRRSRSDNLLMDRFAQDIRLLRLDLLSRERQALDGLYARGQLSAEAWRDLGERLDLQVTAVSAQA